jgi:hypothetical protein
MNVFNKYTRAKFYLKFKKLFNSKMFVDQKSDITQEHVMKIANSIISKPETEFIESHIEHLVYMHWDHITIKLYYEDNRIIMMNGKYFYYFTLSQKDTERLKNKIYRVMSHRADKWDKKFASDTLTNLQVILEEVQQKDKY